MNHQEINSPKLKLAIARMLPEKIVIDSSYSAVDTEPRPRWRYDSLLHYYRRDLAVLETEWLYVMHLVEQTLNNNEADVYGLYINGIMFEQETQLFQSVCDWHATFNQRATAMCKVKGITA